MTDADFTLAWKWDAVYGQWGFLVRCIHCGWTKFAPEWDDYTGYDMRDHVQACEHRNQNGHAADLGAPTEH